LAWPLMARAYCRRALGQPARLGGVASLCGQHVNRESIPVAGPSKRPSRQKRKAYAGAVFQLDSAQPVFHHQCSIDRHARGRHLCRLLHKRREAGRDAQNRRNRDNGERFGHRGAQCRQVSARRPSNRSRAKFCGPSRTSRRSTLQRIGSLLGRPRSHGRDEG
jgi:hypothetical protein